MCGGLASLIRLRTSSRGSVTSPASGCSFDADDKSAAGRPRIMTRRRSTLGVVAGVAFILAGSLAVPAPLTTRRGLTPTRGRTSASTGVSTARGGSGETTVGPWTAQLAVSRQGAILHIDTAAPPQGALRADAALIPDPVPARVTLTGAPLPSGGAVLARRLANPIPEGRSAALAFWDEHLDVWVPVQSSVSADRRTVSAHVSHFSFWDVVYYDIGKVFTNSHRRPILRSWHPGMGRLDDVPRRHQRTAAVVCRP